MISMNSGKKAIRFALCGAVAAAMLAGAASAGKVSGDHGKAASSALARGKVEKAIGLAERAVADDPRDAATRLVLAQAYLKAGRFDSAAATFNDAMDLGDNSTRTALSLALCNVAAGRSREAVAILDDWRNSIPASDLGLAYALAGETGRGVAILSDKLRAGENSPKLRQNLAYAYALDGRWREARTMMALDVPAGELDQRLSLWAASARPDDYQRRVAGLLSVPVVADSGQPAQLALNYPPAAEQAAAEAAPGQGSESASVEAPAAEAPLAEAPAAADTPFGAVQPSPSPQFVQAFAGASEGSHAVVQPLPAQTSSISQPVRAVPVRANGAPIAPRATGGTHLVQLGSFSSEQGARRAWGIFAARNPELRNYRMTITPAVVRGKNFWRVAAAGLNNGSARGLCSTVKGRGGACFAYAAINPPPSDDRPRGRSGPQYARRR